MESKLKMFRKQLTISLDKEVFPDVLTQPISLIAYGVMGCPNARAGEC